MYCLSLDNVLLSSKQTGHDNFKMTLKSIVIHQKMTFNNYLERFWCHNNFLFLEYFLRQILHNAVLYRVGYLKINLNILLNKPYILHTQARTHVRTHARMHIKKCKSDWETSALYALLMAATDNF